MINLPMLVNWFAKKKPCLLTISGAFLSVFDVRHDGVGPLLEYRSPLLEQVRTLISLLDLVPGCMHQALLCEYLVNARFCRPISEAGAHAVHRAAPESLLDDGARGL